MFSICGVWWTLCGSHTLWVGSFHVSHVAQDEFKNGNFKSIKGYFCSFVVAFILTIFFQALVDQVSYGPFAISSFYVGMSLLELKSFDESIQECRDKFFPTWKVKGHFQISFARIPLKVFPIFQVAALVWPVLQTINFSLIPEGNRVVFVSICSVLWTTFLAYMKRLDKLKQEQ